MKRFAILFIFMLSALNAFCAATRQVETPTSSMSLNGVPIFRPLRTLMKSQAVRLVSGNNQIGASGYPLKDEFVVQVFSADGKPLAGIPVVFNIIDGTAGTLSSPVSITDGDGMAAVRLNASYSKTGNMLVTASTKDVVSNPVVFKAFIKHKYWLIALALEISGALGLFLFGMYFINNGLQKTAGFKFREFLVKLTSSSIKGIFTGFGITLVNQSSTATVLLEVSLVSAGLLTFYQAMAVTMGAEIGSTVTAQLVAFRLTDFSVVIAGAGAFIIFFSKTSKWRHIGEAVLGIGVIFFGMKIMGDLLTPLTNYAPFMELMENARNPLFAVFAGLIFTLLIHSSGATAAITIVLALSGAISLEQAIPMNLGAQIGTCFTAAFVSIGRGNDGKRTALWHVFHQTMGVIIIFPFITVIKFHNEPAWIYFIRWLSKALFSSNDVARQIAMAHTMASVVNALVFMPLLPFLGDKLTKLLPTKEEEKPFGPKYLDEVLLDTPNIALEQASREVIREGEIVLDMLKGALTVFDTQDLKLAETVSLKDIRADILRNAIVLYLTKIAQEGQLSSEQSKREIQLIFITDAFEGIGDVIDKNILALARKKLENNLWFSDEGWKDIVDLYRKVYDNVEYAITALKRNDLEIARLVADSGSNINHYESALRKRHIGRLNAGLQETLETSSVHLDIIDQLKRINSHAAAVGHTLLGNI